MPKIQVSAWPATSTENTLEQRLTGTAHEYSRGSRFNRVPKT